MVLIYDVTFVRGYQSQQSILQERTGKSTGGDLLFHNRYVQVKLLGQENPHQKLKIWTLKRNTKGRFVSSSEFS